MSSNSGDPGALYRRRQGQCGDGADAHPRRFPTHGQAAAQVVNFGSAGSPASPRERWCPARIFHQRDMDVSGLGFKPGETPFEETPAVLEFASPFSAGCPSSVAAPGIASKPASGMRTFDVVDMEAYALAKVCRAEGADVRLRQVRQRRRGSRSGERLAVQSASRGGAFPRAVSRA